MSRLVISLFLALPLLMPSGFCLCHLADELLICAERADASDSTDRHDDHDSDCPCKNVDAGIRGFRSHDSIDFEGPQPPPALFGRPHTILAEADSMSDRENVPVFPTPPRYVLLQRLTI